MWHATARPATRCSNLAASRCTIHAHCCLPHRCAPQSAINTPLSKRSLDAAAHVLQVLRHALEGVAHLHGQQRLHQSLGPGSVVLSTVQERDAAVMTARLRDLAFSVDVSDAALTGGATISEMMAERRGDTETRYARGGVVVLARFGLLPLTWRASVPRPVLCPEEPQYLANVAATRIQPVQCYPISQPVQTVPIASVVRRLSHVRSKDFSDGLWRRARRGGAMTTAERRAYGRADDMFSAGLLVAYLAFVPFCRPGVVDGPALQRLIESTFRLDFAAIRCVLADVALCTRGRSCVSAHRCSTWLDLQHVAASPPKAEQYKDRPPGLFSLVEHLMCAHSDAALMQGVRGSGCGLGSRHGFPGRRRRRGLGADRGVHAAGLAGAAERYGVSAAPLPEGRCHRLTAACGSTCLGPAVSLW